MANILSPSIKISIKDWIDNNEVGKVCGILDKFSALGVYFFFGCPFLYNGIVVFPPPPPRVILHLESDPVTQLLFLICKVSTPC